jgi:hypothetical protein
VPFAAGDQIMLGALMWHVFEEAVVWLGGPLTLAAWICIIKKAGYSNAWLVIPIAPFAMVIATYIVARLEVASMFGNGFSPFHGLAVVVDMFYLDVLVWFVSWIFFLIFAFSSWPVLSESSSTRLRAPSAARSDRDYSNTSRNIPGAQVTTVVATSTAKTIDTRRRIFCGWCGESIPGNRALGHDCGPKDRPEVICRFCGKRFPDATNRCDTCEASAS